MSDDGPLGKTDPDVFEYLRRKLLGSSLNVIRRSANEISVESGEAISLKIILNEKKKTADFSIFSKSLNRPVAVEEINGSTFMESKMEEELEKEDRIITEEDILLSVDLLRVWAKDNGYVVMNDGQEEQKKPSAKIGKPAKS